MSSLDSWLLIHRQIFDLESPFFDCGFGVIILGFSQNFEARSFMNRLRCLSAWLMRRNQNCRWLNRCYLSWNLTSSQIRIILCSFSRFFPSANCWSHAGSLPCSMVWPGWLQRQMWPMHHQLGKDRKSRCSFWDCKGCFFRNSLRQKRHVKYPLEEQWFWAKMMSHLCLQFHLQILHPQIPGW